MKIAASIFKTFFLSLCIIANMHLAFAQTASILPQGKTQFLDNNGKPLTSGTVDFYIPSTTTRKTTWQNSGETISNANPVVLDAGGRAIIYGDGTYRQVVKDRLNNIIWDQLTSSTGSGGGGISPTATGDGDLVGTIKPWAGMTVPNQYAFTYGQEVSRTTFATLFTAITSAQPVFCNSGSPTLSGLTDTTNFWIGMTVEISCVAAGFTTITAKTSSTVTMAANSNVTTNVTATFFPWGNGNHTTTFNLPDLRGLIPVGNNNMGGVASTNLNTTAFGVTTPNSTGAIGGSYSTGGLYTLLNANLPPYTPTLASGTFSGTTSRNVVSAATGGGVSIVGVSSAGGVAGATSDAGNTTLNQVAVSGTIAATMNAQGGTSTAFGILPPLRSTNYIIKTTPDTNSATASGVTSLGGMTGDIACGSGVTCTGNIISVNIPISIANGGTGQTTALAARSSAGLNIDEATSTGDANYTILPIDRLVYHTALSAARTDTLPAANSVNAGQILRINDIRGVATGSNTVTVQRAGSDTVNAGTSFLALNVAYSNASCISDGVSRWNCSQSAGSGTGTVTSVTCGTGLSGGTITASGTCAVNLTSFTNSLGANVALNNTANYFDGPTAANGAQSGLWFASGAVTMQDSGVGAVFPCKLWDGTTVIASGQVASSGAGVTQAMALSGQLSNPAANIRISCKDASAITGAILFNNTGNSKDSTVTTFRIQ